jgi:hypothetical protein
VCVCVYTCVCVLPLGFTLLMFFDDGPQMPTAMWSRS